MRRAVFTYLIVILVLLLPISVKANLITNGNFELGAVGFFSEYAHSPTNIWTEGTYAAVTNPYTIHALAHSFQDHTNGAGNMLAFNGASVAGTVVWEELIAVMPNTNYDFAAYLATWQSALYPIVPASLRFSINGELLGDLVANMNPGVWDLFFTTWNSGSATTANIALLDTNVAVGGNDFALDDMYFGAPVYSIPEPTNIQLLLIGVALLAFSRTHHGTMR